jgi:hypothetical protein
MTPAWWLTPAIISCGFAAFGAPAPAPFPKLLLHERARPPWHVAGIDYAVGLPANMTLKDPARIDMPGVGLDPSSHLLRVTGDNITLDGYDFALQGGWGIIIEGHHDTVSRANFKVGSNNTIPIRGAGTAADFTILDSTIDGGGAGPHASDIWAVIDDNGHGMTIERCWIKNTPVDAIDFNGDGKLIAERNLFNNLGYAPGAHADAIQFTHGHVTGADIVLNTVYDPQPVAGFPVPGGEGLQVEAQLGGSITDAHVARNTIVTTGPLKTAGYLIAVRQDEGSRLDGVVVEENYLDSTGGWGAFYPPSGRRVVFRGNVDMVKGRVLF